MASYVSPTRQTIGVFPRSMGRWLIPADAPPGQDPPGRRAGLPVLAAVLLRRSWRRRPHDSAGAQELSDRRRDAAAVPLARGGHLRAAQGQVRPEHLLRREPEDPAGRLDGGGECANCSPSCSSSRGRRRLAIPTSFRVNLRSIIELYARPMGPTTVSAARRGRRRCCSSAARTCRSCCSCAARIGSRSWPCARPSARDAAAIVQQLLTEALAIAVAGAALGVLIAWKGLALIVAWVPTNSFAVRIGHRDERAGPAVQHWSGGRDGDCVRRLAGAAALASGYRPGRAGQHAARDWQRARATRRIV